MKFGICNLSVIPMRLEASDSSEQISQILYGEIFKLLDINSKWTYIELEYDGYKGWIDNKQYDKIDKKVFDEINNKPSKYSYDLVQFVENKNNLTPILIGSSLNSLVLNNSTFEGNKISGIKDKSKIVNTSKLFLNSPYQWGGRTPFGIDCSGFTQIVYKLNGYKIFRDAKDQANLGQPLSFIDESEPGDLAFFDNKHGDIIHVGIIMRNNHIIHAHGNVRIDRLDQTGIYNIDTKRHSHKLRVIKKII